jgi:hypothetical protein
MPFHKGLASTYEILEFTADANVNVNAWIQFGYKIDNGPVLFGGPQNFASHTQYMESRYNLSLVVLGAGDHIIRPYWRDYWCTRQKGHHG